MVDVLTALLNSDVGNDATSEAAHTIASVGAAAIALVGEVLANQTASAGVAPQQSVALFVHAAATFAESERAYRAVFLGGSAAPGSSSSLYDGGGSGGAYDDLAVMDDVLRDACGGAEEGAGGLPDGVATVFKEHGLVLQCSSHQAVAQVPVAVQASAATLV